MLTSTVRDSRCSSVALMSLWHISVTKAAGYTRLAYPLPVPSPRKTSENDHLAQGLPARQPVEAVIDIPEFDSLGQQ